MSMLPESTAACMLLAASLLLCLPPPGRAQEPELDDGAPAEYRPVIEEAVREYSAQHLEEARALFLRAHTLFPNARTLRGLGASEFELRNYGESVRYLEQALAATVRPLEGELRARTERLLARARGFVARLQLEVLPATGLALVDGVPVPNARDVMLDLGDHTIEVHAPGYLPEKRTVHVNGGESTNLHIVLTVRVDAAPRADGDLASKAWFKRPWLWVGVAAVAAGVGTTLALTLSQRGPHYDGGSTGAVVGRN